MSEELTKMTCPECGRKIEVKRDWDGEKCKCPYCGAKFIIQLVDESTEDEAPVSEWSYEDLVETVKVLGDELRSDMPSKRLSELKDDLTELGTEIKKRMVVVRQQAEEKAKTELPVVVRFLFPIANKFRKQSKAEKRYDALWNEVDALYVKWKALKLRQDQLDVAQKEVEEKRLTAKREEEEKRQAEEWARKKNEALDAAVLEFVRRVRSEGLPSISNAGLDLQAGEIVHYMANDVECCIPRAKEDEKAGVGTLFVTNKRILFSGEGHRQQYRVSNLRDFGASWYAGIVGSIKLATSDKRREKYQVVDPWRCSFIIAYLFSADFRDHIVGVDEHAACGFVCEKIGRFSVALYALLCISKYCDSFERVFMLLGMYSYPQDFIMKNREAFRETIGPYERVNKEHSWVRSQMNWLHANWEEHQVYFKDFLLSCWMCAGDGTR